ncbi:proline-, glutamic acid- and leucine-rich protein 1 [Diaphorina citri]|uniref:Proline-, glutamic acid- and leucine-rich protein 1 n=2 Tax=Diaphorina citri TaxID=121845 RepID=A0A3Q0JJX0_DIACI|nr:proline-, glutamic acid- and leucine-rich protein 1 [Diaphorina citri]
MSENLKNLLSDVVFENEFSSPSLQTILKSCNEYQNFTNKDVSFINQINSNLNSNTNVEQNHLLLNTVILQASEELLVSHAVTWMSVCIKSSDTFSASIQSLDYSNLYLLISKTHHSNDVKKQFVASILPKFVLKLETVPSCAIVCGEKLKCLEKVLKHYNGPCFSHYKVIEKFLLQCIELWHSSDSLITRVGLCYSLLSQLGGGGHQTALYRDNWQTQLCKLVKYMHEVLDHVFEDVPEMQTVPIPASIRTLEVTIPFLNFYLNVRETTKLHASLYLLRTFKVLSTLIRTHLAAPFPAPKTINIEAILSVIARCLSITPPILSNLDATTGHAILLSLLPELHTRTHAVLNTLITVAGRNLIPYSLYICKLTVHSLKWTNTDEGCRYALERPFRVLRCGVYRTLHSWLTVAGCASNIELLAEELVPYLLSDITYEKPPVTLTTVTKKTRKKHKTKVGLETEKRPLAAGGETTDPSESRGDLCSLSHLVVVAMLQSAGVLLKPDLVKSIQTQIAGLLLSLSTGSSVQPYSVCPSTRLALYSTLEALILYTGSQVSDLSHYANVFYHAGLNDSYIEVRKVCQRGIETLEKIHHPKADSLNFVPENLAEEKLQLLAGAYTNHAMNGTESHDDEMEGNEKITRDGDARLDKSANRHGIGKANAKGNATDKTNVDKPDVNGKQSKRKRDLETPDESENRNKKLKNDNKNDTGRKTKERTGMELAIVKNKDKVSQGKKGAIVNIVLDSDGSDEEEDDEEEEDSDEEDTDDDLESDVESDDSDFDDDNDDATSFPEAMMLMDIMQKMRSDYDGDFLEDDVDDSDDESSLSLFDGDSDSANMDSDDDSDDNDNDDDRQGVVITEIVDEETTAIATDGTAEEGSDKTDKSIDDKRSDNDKSTDKNDPKKDKSDASKSGSATDKTKADKADKAKTDKTKSDKSKTDKSIDAKSNIEKSNKANVDKAKTSKAGSETSKGKNAKSKDAKSGTGKAETEVRGKDKTSKGKGKSTGENKAMDIDVIDLDENESDEMGSENSEGNESSNKESDRRSEEREEITLSGDSQDEVITLDDKEGEKEEEEDVGEEVSDCLKLFNVE